MESARIFVNQSHLIGLYVAMNSTGCVLPDFAEKGEQKILKSKGLNLCLLDSRYGAVGNNVLVNDRACLLNPRVPAKDAKKIRDCFGVEVFQQPVSGISTVGAINAVTNKGLLAYPEITAVELKRLEKMFGVKGVGGSVNMGSPFNSFGVVANSNGALVGESTSGAEMQKIYEALFG